MEELNRLIRTDRILFLPEIGNTDEWPLTRTASLLTPFDFEYRPIFYALVFAAHDCGYFARCALEIDDSGLVRIQKIEQIIADCRFGIHDISRVEPDPRNHLPRFNMPLELGLFLGAKRYGDKRQKAKSCKILDVDRYRFQQFCSDISGQDISAHHGDAGEAIKAVRNWLGKTGRNVLIPSGSKLVERYQEFQDELPMFVNRYNLQSKSLRSSTSKILL